MKGRQEDPGGEHNAYDPPCHGRLLHWVQKRGAMAEQAISCPSCGKKIPLTRALRAEIESSVKEQYDEGLRKRERELRSEFAEHMKADLERAATEAARAAEQKACHALSELKEQLNEQSKELEERRKLELAIRKRERELERSKEDLELTVERTLADERARVVAETQKSLTDQHRLKDAEKERQLLEMRRQIEDLKRKAEQGSQQLQGEAGEDTIELMLRTSFPCDDISPVAQGVRGADIHQVVTDSRGGRAGAILWECKNAKNWSDGWIEKLKTDQRALRADVSVLVTAALPKGCCRFALVDGVLVTDFTCAGPVAALLRSNLLHVAQARSAALNKGEKLELLHRYLSGIEFRQRVEAIVESFERMRDDLDQERRAAERQWAKRTKQIESV
ncbi:MAG: hypothetical protein V7647_3618, partial [Acidobacteriota bacterium]